MIFLYYKGWKLDNKAFLKNLLCVGYIGVFLIFLLSFFNSTDNAEYFSILKNKLPFLFIPFSLFAVKKIEKKQFYIVVYTFILCCFISSLWSYFQYRQDHIVYEKLYLQGGVMPTLTHHVSFSALLSIGALFLLHTIFSLRLLWLRVLSAILLCWFIYFIHLLSVRTGLVFLYVGLPLFVLVRSMQQKQPRISILILAGLICFGMYSYLYFPTVKNKLAYTAYGVEQYINKGDSSNQVSDSRRFLSDKIGLDLLKKNSCVGVGVGDIQKEMNLIYKTKYSKFSTDVFSHIHNQYIFTLVGVGVFLGSLFCVFLLFPLVQFIKDGNILFSIIYVLLLLVMLWEPFLQNQLGTSIYLFLGSLGYLSKEID